MKEENALRLGFTYAGCFLGAGFVSGQELWQFFGAFGPKGFWGLGAAVILFFLFGVMLLRLIHKTSCYQPDILVAGEKNIFLRTLSGIFQLFFWLGVYVIMAAGVGALGERMMGLSPALGSFLFCLVVTLLSLGGTRGMMNVFSVAVPLLMVSSVVISFLTVSRCGVGKFTFLESNAGQNPLLKTWWLAAFTYVSYNIFVAIGILAPIGEVVRQKKTVLGGIAVGCGILLAIAGGIVMALGSQPEAVQAELPMLEVAASVGPVWYRLYGFLLLVGMMGTSLSCTVAAANYCYRKVPFWLSHRVLLASSSGTIIWLCSLGGFGELVGTVYPIFGYCGAAALLGLIIHFFKVSSRVKIKCKAE